MQLDQQNMNCQEYGGGCGQHRYMKSKEPRERCTGNVVAAAQKPEGRAANHRNDSGDLCTDFGSTERNLVPGSKIAAKTEADRNEQEEYATHPRHLAWPVIGTQEKHAEQVDEQSGDHQICRPTVDRTDQPAKLHFSDDKLHALKSVFRTGTIVEKQQNSSDYLYDKKKERHATEVVPDRMTMKRDFFLLRYL